MNYRNLDAFIEGRSNRNIYLIADKSSEGSDKMNRTTTETYQYKNMGLIIYTLFNLVFLVFVVLSLLFNEGYFALSFFSCIFMGVVTLPIVLSRFNWTHPLMIQMVLFLMQAISISLMATGYIDLNFYRTSSFLAGTDLEILAIKTILVNSIGLMITYYFSFSLKIKLSRFEFSLKNSKAIYLLLAIAWGSFYLIVSKLGGITVLIENFQQRLVVFSGESLNYYIYLTQLGSYAAIYLYLIGNKKTSFFVFTVQILINLLMGDRGYIIFNIIIPLVIIVHLHKKKIPIRKMIIYVLCVLVFYQLYGNLRRYGSYNYGNPSIFESVLKVFKDIEHFGITATIIGLVDGKYVNYLYGKPLFNIIFAPLPRSIFPWKPMFIAESALVGALIYNIDYVYIGLPPGLYGYGYLNFGWLGVILFSIITGLIINIFYNKNIGYYLKRRLSIPNGNLFVYVIFINLIVNPISTEVQIKMLMAFIPLLWIYFTSKKKME